MLKTTLFRLQHFHSLLAFLSIFFTLLFLWPGCARAADVTVAWDPNTEPTVAGYKVVYGLSSRNYTYTVDVGISTSLAIPSGLQPGTTYYFAALAYDATGQPERLFQRSILSVSGCSRRAPLPYRR